MSIPVSVGGVAVNPGDLVVGDVDGVAVVPRGEIEAVLAAAQKKVDAEAQRIEETEEGILVSPRLDDRLRQAGLPALGA